MVQKIGNDTAYCFTISQTKALAKQITKGIYSDSLANSLERENALLGKVITVTDSIVMNLNLRIELADSLVNNQTNLIGHQQSELNAANDKLKRVKGQRTVLGSALVILVVLLVL